MQVSNHESTVYKSTARNFGTNTENRIHEDGVAAQFGFAGALVPGAAVFGHMVHPLANAFGPDWLVGQHAEVRFLKPAYDGDELTIRHVPAQQEQLVQCHARGVLLSELRLRAADDVQPEPEIVAAGEAVGERPEIAWHNIDVDVPFPAWTWTPDALANAEAAAQVDDHSACYQEGVLHPHVLLSLANRAFTHRYYLPAWMHVGSTIRLMRPLRVGDAIEIRCVPTRKWERKGHEFVDLRIVYLVAGEIATEIVHTSIFKIAARS